MAHKGFADDINLIGGVTELLVNRHSRIGNTAVSLHPDSKVECENMTSENNGGSSALFIWKPGDISRKHGVID